MKKLLTMLLSFVLLVGAAIPVSAASDTAYASEEGSFSVSMEKGEKTGKVVFTAPSTGNYRFNMYSLGYEEESGLSEDDNYYKSLSSKYDRIVKIKATKGKKVLINTKLSNFHKRLVLIQKGSGNAYDNLFDLAEQYLDLNDAERLKWEKGYKTRDDFTVKLKKGESVTLTVTSDKKASTFNLDISKE